MSAAAEIAPGVVSVDDHFTEGNVHLISNYWGLDSFMKAPLPDGTLSLIFIPTAARPYSEHNAPSRFLAGERAWLNRQQAAGRITYSEYCVAGRPSDEIREVLQGANVIFMGGGNTQYLLQQLQDTGAGDIIRELVIMDRVYDGKTGWQLAVELARIAPTAYILDNNERRRANKEP